MQEIGEIIDINGKEALVRIRKNSACSKCSNKCHLAELDSHESTELEVMVENKIGAQKGQLVKLEMQTQPLIVVSFLVYIFPLLSLILGYYLGLWLAPFLGLPASEGIGIVAAIFFLLLSFGLVHLFDKYLGKKREYHPEITGLYYE